MSRRISVDGAASGDTFLISDQEYAGIDWGSKAKDIVICPLENGGLAVLNWESIGAVFISGAAPQPGSYPGWHVSISGPYGGVDGLHINDAAKDTLVAAMDIDVIVEFTTLQGTDVKLPSKNATVIYFNPGDYVVPD